MADKERDKVELLDQIARAKQEGRRLSSEGRDLVFKGEQAIRFAETMEKFITVVPSADLPPEGLSNSITTWSTWTTAAGHVTIDPSLTQGLDYAASNVAVTASGIMTNAVMLHVPAPDYQTAKDGYEEFYRIVEHPRCHSDVVSLIGTLALDESGLGQKSSLDLLADAKNALEAPSSGRPAPISVLVSVREATNRILADLLRRRSNQEKAKGVREKVDSILKQCGYAWLSADQIRVLGNEAERLMDDLSDAKQADLDRPTIFERYTKALLFLRSLLQGLDASRFRK